MFRRREYKLCLVLFSAAAAVVVPKWCTAQFDAPVDLIYSWEGESDADAFGFVSRSLGDVDNDGVIDLGIGVPGVSENGPHSGKVYVYSGATGALIRSHLGSAENDRFGYAMGGVGDVTADGFGDYVVCRPRTLNFQQYFGLGEVVLFSGANGDSLKAWNAELLGSGVSQATGCGNFDQRGVGDVNNDGVPDILISAIIGSGPGGLVGRVHVISGADWDEILHTFFGETNISLFGFGIGGAGDLDNDGFDDILAGAPNAGPGARGRAYAFSGRTGEAFPFSPFEPDTTGAFFGFLFTKGAGDVNADGVPDISVTDLQDNEAGAFAGKAYVFSGSDGSLLHRFVGSEAGAGLGAGRGCGDVDFDGHNDLIYAAFTDPGIADGAGSIFLFSGKDGTVLREVRGTLEGDSFGYSTIGVGDLDGDGSLDFAGAAVFHDGAGVDRGKVYVIAGDIFPDPASSEEPDHGTAVRSGFQLQLGPNPSFEQVQASFVLSSRELVRVDVLDVAGARVRSLWEGERLEGEHRITWDLTVDDGQRVAGGVYFVLVSSESQRETKTLIVR